MPPEHRDPDDAPPDDGGDNDAVAIRPFWSGTISFGLVSIPVNLFPGSRSSAVSLRMLDQDGTPLSRRYYCPEHDRDVEPDEIIRGYEVDGGWVTVTDDELEALEPERTRDIELERFVDAGSIDPVFFQRSYYLAPPTTSSKAYRLLAETMERTGRAGIATFVMRGKQYLVAILAENGILRAETLRFREEIRDVDEIGLPEGPRPKAARLKRMEAGIRELAGKELEPRELEDRAARRLLDLIEAKRKRRKDVVTAPEAAREEAGAPIIDLMDVLKRNLRGATGS